MLFQKRPPSDRPNAFPLDRIEDSGGMGGAGRVASPTKFRSGAWVGAEIV